MFLLLAGGAVIALARDPVLRTALSNVKFEPRSPSFALGSLSWSELVVGTVFQALPQVLLALDNAIIAITDENKPAVPSASCHRAEGRDLDQAH
jgi:hypothetical protein